MNHTYKVPIIPQNLNKQETIIQVAEALNHLSNITDDMFTRISKRVEASNSKLLNISDRIAQVNLNIEKLTGAKKATQVFSSCKYPGSDLNQPYVSIFSDAEPLEFARHKVKHKKGVFNDEPMDKLHIYHVKIKKNTDNKNMNGLGEIPCDIECVNDLLLYNSGKNLYKNFVMSNALDMNQQIREQDQSDASSIGAAPLSISERSTLTRSSTQNYFYTPNLGEVPALDVPIDLPDLPNIAGDLRYSIDIDPGIAPSVITTPNIPDLPPIAQNEVYQSKEDVLEVELPPPPLPEPIKEEPIQITKAPSLEKIAQQPEPPLPPAQPSEESTAPIVKKISELPPLDDRASLMDAIRKAGGAKNLKSAGPIKKDSAKKSVVRFFFLYFRYLFMFL